MKQVILITGASSGIGKATALRLAMAGHCVYGAARQIQKCEDLRRGGVRLLTMDVANSEDRRKAVDTVIFEQGRIDVLINNAGFGLYGAVEDIPLSDARQEWEVNLFGMAAMIQLTLPHMRLRRKGRIINLASMAGRMYAPMGAWYHASKYAIEGFSHCLRLELKPSGIDVVLIEPGLINTPFYDLASQCLEEYSCHSAYQNMAQSTNHSLKAIRRGRGILGGSDPFTVARIITRAACAKNPKARYTTGHLARLSILSEALLPTRIFDFCITKIMAPDR